MKTYTVKRAIELNLLPWSLKTIWRMRDRGEIKLINIGQGQQNRWAITDAEIQRVMNAQGHNRVNKMVNSNDLNKS